MKTIIITGCEGDIGYSLTKYFAEMKYFVIGIDKKRTCRNSKILKISYDLFNLIDNKKELEKFKKLLKKSLNGKILIGLINNAALQIISDFEKLSLKQFRKSLDVNTTIPFLLSKLFYKKLSYNNGKIINICSIHSQLTKPKFIAYATSKSALEGLTKSMAVELGEKIRVIGILPAAIKTGMLLRGLNGSYLNLKKLEKYHPTNCIGSTEEIAILIYFIIENKLNFMNGSLINIDGGVSSRLHDPF